MNKKTIVLKFSGYSAAFVVLLLLSACWFSQSLTGDSEQKTDPASTATVLEKPAKQKSFVFEEPAATPMEEPVSTQPNAVATHVKKRPQVAIIIDDMGYHQKICRGLLELDLNLSFAFLPHAPFVPELDEIAYRKGRDILVHIPMEAQSKKWDPGPGALYLKTPPEKQLVILTKDLAAIPHAIGANNHMGSKFTANRKAIHRVLAELKRQDLFFIDSFTSGKSKGFDEAQKMGLKTNRRQIFLDNVQNSKKICHQLDKLITKARKNGQAIAIGHPYQATLEAFRKCGDRLSAVEIVSVHELVK